MFNHAITRKPGGNVADGLTSAGLGRPEHALTVAQHDAYVETLKQLGLTVDELDALPAHPDAHFVEDTAVVTPEVAVITIPGAPTRRGEQDSIEKVLTRYRDIARIQPPGTVDGGDVLIVDRQVFVGVSGRTNEHGARQLGDLLSAHGYNCTLVEVQDGLHLKSEVNGVGGRTLLITPRFAGHQAFDGYDKIVLGDSESYAANTLWVNGCLLTPKGFADTRSRLADTGCDIVELDTSEIRKMDGGLTCLSLRF